MPVKKKIVQPREEMEEDGLRRIYAAQFDLGDGKAIVIVGEAPIDTELAEDVDFDDIGETVVKAVAKMFVEDKIDYNTFTGFMDDNHHRPDSIIWLPNAARALVGFYTLPE